MSSLHSSTFLLAPLLSTAVLHTHMLSAMLFCALLRSSEPLSTLSSMPFWLPLLFTALLYAALFFTVLFYAALLYATLL